MGARVVNDPEAARTAVLDLVPSGAEVFTLTSRTLDQIGVAEALNDPSRYNSVRARLAALDPASQMADRRRLTATPEYAVGSVHAVTETGQVVVASATGSQLGPYAFGAPHVVWVVGAQKVVPTLDDAFRRIREYSLPLEDVRARAVYGQGSAAAKLLVVDREFSPGRIEVVLVNANLGF